MSVCAFVCAEECLSMHVMYISAGPRASSRARVRILYCVYACVKVPVDVLCETTVGVCVSLFPPPPPPPHTVTLSAPSVTFLCISSASFVRTSAGVSCYCLVVHSGVQVVSLLRMRAPPLHSHTQLCILLTRPSLSLSLSPSHHTTQTTIEENARVNREIDHIKAKFEGIVRSRVLCVLCAVAQLLQLCTLTLTLTHPPLIRTQKGERLSVATTCASTCASWCTLL